MTQDTGGGVHCLKISGPYLLRFGSEDDWKIWRKRLTHSVTYVMNDEGVFRTVPGTLGLLITDRIKTRVLVVDTPNIYN